jgi:hypothetical protein
MFNNMASLGGYVQAISTAFDRNNNLYAFGIGGDKAVYYRSESTSGSWSNWTSLGGAALSIDAIQNANGNLDVFAIGTNNALYCNTYAPPTATTKAAAIIGISPPPVTISSWSGWIDLGEPMVFINEAAAVRATASTTGVLTTGTSTIGSPPTVSNALGLVSINAIVSPNGTLSVFAIGTNQAVYCDSQMVSGTWSGWTGLGGTVKSIATSLDAQHHVNVFGIGTDNAVWYRSQSAATSTWSNWTSLGGDVQSISTCLDATGKLDVVAISSSLGVFESSESTSGTWNGWNLISNFGEMWSSAAVAADPNGNLDIYAINSNGSVQYQVQNATGTWSGWMLTNGSLKSFCLATDSVRGDIDVLGIGSNNAAYILENATFTPVNIPLFGATGSPSYLDVQQGSLDDCWLLASLAEVAARAPSDIKSMFTFDGSTTENGSVVNTYTVRFYNQNNVAEYVKVDTELPPNGNFDQTTTGVLWVALAEKAYVVANSLGIVQSNHVGADDYAALNFGQSAWGLQAITGKLAYGTGSAGINASDIATAWKQGQFILFNTTTPADSTSIVENHVYALIGYNPSSSQPFELFNPWGTLETNLSDSKGSAATGTATVLGYAPGNAGTIFGLFYADTTFVLQNYFNDSLTKGASPMSPKQMVTTLPVAPAEVTRAEPLNTVFSNNGGPANSNGPLFERSADQRPLFGADSATGVSADNAASFLVMHKQAIALDALFANFGSFESL